MSNVQYTRAVPDCLITKSSLF